MKGVQIKKNHKMVHDIAELAGRTSIICNVTHKILTKAMQHHQLITTVTRIVENKQQQKNMKHHFIACPNSLINKIPSDFSLNNHKM